MIKDRDGSGSDDDNGHDTVIEMVVVVMMMGMMPLMYLYVRDEKLRALAISNRFSKFVKAEPVPAGEQ